MVDTVITRRRTALAHEFRVHDKRTWECKFAHISGLPANPHVLIDGVAHRLTDGARIVRFPVTGEIKVYKEDEFLAMFEQFF